MDLRIVGADGIVWSDSPISAVADGMRPLNRRPSVGPTGRGGSGVSFSSGKRQSGSEGFRSFGQPSHPPRMGWGRVHRAGCRGGMCRCGALHWLMSCFEVELGDGRVARRARTHCRMEVSANRGELAPENLSGSRSGGRRSGSRAAGASTGELPVSESRWARAAENRSQRQACRKRAGANAGAMKQEGWPIRCVHNGSREQIQKC
jgi:hypothetical protein